MCLISRVAVWHWIARVYALRSACNPTDSRRSCYSTVTNKIGNLFFTTTNKSREQNINRWCTKQSKVRSLIWLSFWKSVHLLQACFERGEGVQQLLYSRAAIANTVNVSKHVLVSLPFKSTRPFERLTGVKPWKKKFIWKHGMKKNCDYNEVDKKQMIWVDVKKN